MRAVKAIPISADDSLAAIAWTWVGRAALALAITVVLSRSITLEYCATRSHPSRGSSGSPRAGAEHTLLLDSLAAAPALMVLARATSTGPSRSGARGALAYGRGWRAGRRAGCLTRGDDRFAATVDRRHSCSALSLLGQTAAARAKLAAGADRRGDRVRLLLIYATHAWSIATSSFRPAGKRPKKSA